MHRTGALALFAAVGLAAAASSANAATTLTVGPDSLCGASGCFGADKKAYTRTFSAAEGGGVISSLSLFRGLVGATPNQAVRITFQLADGTEVVWGNYRVGMMQGDQFVTIQNFEGFAWDSAMGDLTLKLELVDLKMGGGGSGAGWGFGGGGSPVDGGGGTPFTGGSNAPELPFGGVAATLPLVRPSLPVQPIVAVPEPQVWAMMILGFGAAGAMLRRRKSYHLKYN